MEFLNESIMTTDILEAEMNFNNIYHELLSEEISLFLNEDDPIDHNPNPTDYKMRIKEVANKLLQAIIDIWIAFISRIKDVVNKIIIHMKLADKFMDQNRKYLQEFEKTNMYFSDKKIKVSPLLFDHRRFDTVMNAVRSVKIVSDDIMKVKIRPEDISKDTIQKELSMKLSNAKKEINKMIVEKEEVTPNKDLYEKSKLFLLKGYDSLVAEFSKMYKTTDSIIRTSKNNFISKFNVDTSTRDGKLAVNGYIEISRMCVSTVIECYSRMLSLLNQLYTDSFTVCRMTVAEVKKRRNND